jgi:hypothetical protein
VRLREPVGGVGRGQGGLFPSRASIGYSPHNDEHDGRDRQLRCAGAVRHAAVGAASRRVPLRLQHDRLVEVSHAGGVQPAARDLVQIRRRPPSVRTPTPLGWPRAPRGRRRRRVRARSPWHCSTSSTALPAPGGLAAVLIAMTRFSMMCARSGPMSERRCSRSAADRRRCFCLAIRLSRLRLPMPGVWRTGPTCR